MNISQSHDKNQIAISVWFTDEMICLRLDDGREICTPLEFYPTLANASKEQLENCRILPGGTGINWQDLDEDLSVESIVLGRQAFNYPGIDHVS